MDNDKVKSLMRKYLGDLVDLPELQYLFVDDPEKEYRCIRYYSKNFSHLHKCILRTNYYPRINDYLEEYLQLYNNINQVDINGCTALHLASYYSRTRSTERTVELLINAGVARADIYLKNNYNKTPFDYFDDELKDKYLGRYTKRAIKNN